MRSNHQNNTRIHRYFLNNCFAVSEAPLEADAVSDDISVLKQKNANVQKASGPEFHLVREVHKKQQVNVVNASYKMFKIC